MAAITVKALLEAGAHFGHQVYRWNPRMNRYIFGKRNRVHIIDLQKAVHELRKAYKFICEVSSSGKAILFVGTKKTIKGIVEEEAKRCGAFYVAERWVGGTLTNFAVIRQAVSKLRELEKAKAEGLLDLLSKKEASRREKERLRLEKIFQGIKEMETFPGAIFIVDSVKEKIAIDEARKVGIPVVAICDTDADPDVIDYPIPGNDDAVRSVKLFCSFIADAVIEGKSIIQQQSVAVSTEQNILPEEPNKAIVLGGEHNG